MLGKTPKKKSSKSSASRQSEDERQPDVSVPGTGVDTTNITTPSAEPNVDEQADLSDQIVAIDRHGVPKATQAVLMASVHDAAAERYASRIEGVRHV